MGKRCPFTLQAHHVGIFNSDMEKAINWWRDNFDMRERRKRVNPLPDHGNSYMCQARVGGIYLELYNFDIPQQTEENFWNTFGTKHVAFTAYDKTMDEVKAYFDEKGIRYEDSTEVILKDDGTRVNAIWFYDIDGTRMEMVEDYYPDAQFGDRSEFELFRTKSTGEGKLRIVLHHVAMYSRSIEETAEWMWEKLGLYKAWESTETGNDGKQYRVALLRGDRYYLEIHERPDFQPQPKEAYWGTLGMKHISLFDKDEHILPLVEYNQAQGCEFNVVHHWKQEYNCIPGGYHVAFFPTPEGTTIELNGTFWPGEGLYPGEVHFDD